MKIKKLKLLIILVIVLIAIAMITLGLIELFKTSDSKNQKTTTKTLVCTMKNSDNYEITINTKYEDEKVDSIEMIYQPPEKEEVYEQKNETAIKVLNYASLQGVTYTTIDNEFHLFLEKKAYDANKNNTTITKMFLNYSKLKSYYEQDGYTCK